ncbi:hypothetical protein CWATWH8502_1079 [Crocosphaera watsonii WH 8502]|uniref:Uncharacterized protein n=5 Tax=Crocosphaera watsonii TaxID=263511 RepID=T2JUM0_CROWT|nr:hypothetical protein CWATWH0003_1704 [Crocosphaera watsonii WH 0003]CCQ53122.1 hypothetical protein CWATWH8502_1079 [Crocosphaera watsonii WH 8502]CCQ54375.1 hypothetical protein CWATWH0005_4386 [Crocosphaera watsonii WH 0005]CCQ59845.1 hypothetical protein CWATWH0401_3597 [Crocosphaera watsonii WH 0401]CCQ68322.1 hypothetical protein CWATWH0402_5083 [Crocosphaera watsonii WH 0402]
MINLELKRNALGWNTLRNVSSPVRWDTEYPEMFSKKII